MSAVARVVVHAPLDRLWGVLRAWAADGAEGTVDAEARSVRVRGELGGGSQFLARIEVPRSACMTGPAVLIVESTLGGQGAEAVARRLKASAESAVD
ncbi:MAG: hypothetical protein KC466_19315 [Myxococcales bacterium]|nr:hypothetical protein [Myxococcales bacterium]